MSYVRSISVERASINEDTGEFRAVLFTDGEASDGHILNISGGRIPDQIPLFVNHAADPRTQLGSLFFERKTAHQVHMRGQVFIDGEGPESEIRRDLMAKIAAGHVTRMSGRWDADPSKVKRRMDLPGDHPASVGEKASGAKRYGLYFEEWLAMEGSVVGLGADPAATMRWAEDPDATEAVREFWRMQAETGVEVVEQEAEPEDTESDPSEDEVRSEPEPEPEPDPEPEPEEATEADEAPAPRDAVVKPPTPETQAAALLAQAREMGLDLGLLADAIEAEQTPQDPVAELSDAVNELRESNASLRAELESLRAERESDAEIDAELAPSRGSFSPRSVIDTLRRQLRSERQEHMAQVRAYIDAKRGAVTGNDPRAEMVKNLRVWLEGHARKKGRVQGDPSPPTDLEFITDSLDASRRVFADRLRSAVAEYKRKNGNVTRQDIDDLRALIEQQHAETPEA